MRTCRFPMQTKLYHFPSDCHTFAEVSFCVALFSSVTKTCFNKIIAGSFSAWSKTDLESPFPLRNKDKCKGSIWKISARVSTDSLAFLLVRCSMWCNSLKMQSSPSVSRRRSRRISLQLQINGRLRKKCDRKAGGIPSSSDMMKLKI